ncbi:XdhC family protein [Daeguia caeni]|uniref:XdhC family protein n=1 Tax=Daeguia caeni TaxID=439612 RepID=A0ABV9H950_9HYPH
MDLSPLAAFTTIDENDFPYQPALHDPDHALAIITNTEGPSYRRCGAAMLIHKSGRRYGNLSSGCIDKNIGLRAVEALESGVVKRLRYGKGSPYWDMQLPCGGGLEITIIPYPDRHALEAIDRTLKGRNEALFSINHDGIFAPQLTQSGLNVSIQPQLRVLIFGTGREVVCFASLARAAGCQVEVFSHDADVLEEDRMAHAHMKDDWPDNLPIDARTAVITFYHDHDREPAILGHALKSSAFFVGAQGSKRAHELRCAALAYKGCSKTDIERLEHPLGVIPSTRDPQTLAVSVLAHVLQKVSTSVKTKAIEPAQIRI